LLTFPRCSRPLSDHGKCATGTTKKLLLESAKPAKALYQARNAARIPNPPPALIAVLFGAPLEWSRYPIPRQRKARSRVKKSEKNATVDLRVHKRSRKVNINQPNKKNPKEFKKTALVPPPSAVTIPKPPGVRVMAKEIQKPPYEESAVAPKVFPTAISHMPASN